jgi:hypothetical protein
VSAKSPAASFASGPRSRETSLARASGLCDDRGDADTQARSASEGEPKPRCVDEIEFADTLSAIRFVVEGMMRRFLDSFRFALRFSLRRYTDEAVNALTAAQKLARSRGGNIAPEHLLFGITRSRRSGALAALTKLGLDVDRERATIEALTETRTPSFPGHSPVLDPRTEQLLAHAENHARALRSNYLGTEHLVLGMLDVSGPSAEYLRERGITSQRFLEELGRLHAAAGRPKQSRGG